MGAEGIKRHSAVGTVMICAALGLSGWESIPGLLKRFTNTGSREDEEERREGENGGGKGRMEE